MDPKIKAAAERQKSRAVDYHAVFDSAPGKRVLEDLQVTHYMRTSTFSTDAIEMAKNEGERNVVLRILSILDMDLIELNKLTRQDEGVINVAENPDVI